MLRRACQALTENHQQLRKTSQNLQQTTKYVVTGKVWDVYHEPLNIGLGANFATRQYLLPFANQVELLGARLLLS